MECIHYSASTRRIQYLIVRALLYLFIRLLEWSLEALHGKAPANAVRVPRCYNARSCK